MTKSAYSSSGSEQGSESSSFGVDAFAISATPFAMTSPIQRSALPGGVQQVSWQATPEPSAIDGKRRVSWSSSQHKHRLAAKSSDASEVSVPVVSEPVASEREVSWRMYTLDLPQQNGIDQLLR